MNITRVCGACKCALRDNPGAFGVILRSNCKRKCLCHPAERETQQSQKPPEEEKENAQ